MMSNKKRIIIILISVGAGTMLSALLIMSRRGPLKIEDYSSLVINMLLALVIVISIGVYLGRKKNK